MWREVRIEHFLEGKEEFFLADQSIAVLVNGLDGLEGLFGSYSHIDLQGAEEIVEEIGHLHHI